jgi:hypothetical protein
MKTVQFRLDSASPISFSKAIVSKRDTGESHDAFEERTWRERMHLNKDGLIYIPPMALKLCLVSVAKFLSETIPGKGKATYTKHFKAGTMVVDEIDLGIKGVDVDSERLFLPNPGNMGTRVWKTFPLVKSWSAIASVVLLDPVLVDKETKVLEYLEHAGKFIGLGRFRAENGGLYGRFSVHDFKVI